MDSPARIAQTALNQYQCEGVWTVACIGSLAAMLQNPRWAKKNLMQPSDQHAVIMISGSAITHMDSAGAYLLCQLKQWYVRVYGCEVRWTGFSDQHDGLLHKVEHSLPIQVASLTKQPYLVQCSEWIKRIYQPFWYWLAFLGHYVCACLGLLVKPGAWPVRAVIKELEIMGLQAIPIITLLTFLIGIVLANQAGEQLKMYGADIYLVNITAVAVLREFSPLITAIVLAGRTGAALTAALGSMKVNEEIDALVTMGISPMQEWVIPKLIALTLALPLLVLWGDAFGLLGGFIMAQTQSHIDAYRFVDQLQSTAPLYHYVIGLCKAPLFALIIGFTGCFQGFQVKQSAESVGQHTTKTVVQAIFMIIVLDALFAVLFAWSF